MTSAAMAIIVIVGVVGLCVHVFSLGYMQADGSKARYFGGLSIFMFSMIGIVLADNLFKLFRIGFGGTVKEDLRAEADAVKLAAGVPKAVVALL